MNEHGKLRANAAPAHENGALHACVCDLMDGRLTGSDFAHAVHLVTHDEHARATWHAWHVIGDVMRSTDLAACTHDAAFLSRLRQRLQQEAPAPAALPLPAAPAAAMPALAQQPAANDSVFRWKLVAGLASFAAVAAIGWTTLGAIGPQPAGPQLAHNGSGRTNAAAAQAPAARAPRATALAAASADSGVLRDPRLDDLLAAHRQAAGAPAWGHAQGFLRNATFDGPAR
ncbi:MAG: sigma-E factor negative regulatory protein [Comamonadaceae bacterium]|nr:sigma-E factor negative regulatory protein [Comamonadaceae bacterium]